LYAFFVKVSRQAFQAILQNVFSVLITPQSLACQKFLDVEKQVIITWCKVGTVHRCSKISHLYSSNNAITSANLRSYIVVR